jgi:hypothetical protein
MSRRDRDPLLRRGPSAAVAAVLAGAVVLAACNRGAPDTPPVVTNPPSTGASCDDATGDLSRSASETGGNLREPAGVDLVHAEARVTDTSLRVSFTTVAPLAGVPNPEFRLAQGPAGQLESFELVSAPEGQTWALRLVTFRPDGRGGVTEGPRAVLPVPVHVDGSTLSYEVPLSEIPKIATYVWLFGSSSSTNPDGDDTVIDVCEDYGPGSTAVPSTGG